MTTPQLHLETLFILNSQGRILSTREPGPSRRPLFTIIRSVNSCVWAMRADLPQTLADELDRLAQEELPIQDLREEPLNAEQYMSLLGRHLTSGPEVETNPRLFSGPAFAFPDSMVEPATAQSVDIELIEDETRLKPNFRGWEPGELVAGRGPMLAVVENGLPVSICFCARRSDVATEAGLETAEAYRGRGYGPLVTTAWAQTIRASGRIPLYSTAWTNEASLSVARKLGLMMYASDWSLSD